MKSPWGLEGGQPVGRTGEGEREEEQGGELGEQGPQHAGRSRVYGGQRTGTGGIGPSPQAPDSIDCLVGSEVIRSPLQPLRIYVAR